MVFEEIQQRLDQDLEEYKDDEEREREEKKHPVALLLLLRKTNGKKPGMRRTYFRLGPLPDRASFGHVTDVTSGQKALTRIDMAQLPVAHAQNILPDRVTSCRVTAVTSGHVTTVTYGHVTSGHVTSGSTTAQHHRKYDLCCAHILLTGLAVYDHWLGNFKNRHGDS